ncbi:MAG: TaqI-like C-terminal specificity domain-containing protein [Chloroherpetonaceae bacterium]
MTIAPDFIQKAIQHVQDEQTLLAFLRNELQWRISEDAELLRDTTYAWSHDELQLDETCANVQFRQLKPFVQNQWAGIFIVKFPENAIAYKTTLRKALRTLVTKKRGGSTRKTWELENLFFICTPNYKDFTFAHYTGENPRTAKLQTFSWQHGSPYLRTLCEYNLPNLALPDSLEDDTARDEWKTQWLSAFDVEKVTERFFQDFETAFQTILAKKFVKPEKENRLLALTTLNRLMFLYFIQKKGWLNDNETYLQTKLAEAEKKKLVFYNDYLKRIYFEFLSVPIHERNKRSFAESAREIHSLIGRIPFLNGGLFDKKDFDDHIKFSNDEFKAIFGFFNRYAFTVAENTPLDIEVAVDPEMLGKVFESLIGEERKQKGMFYTPSAVVSFMCKESLLQFLSARFPAEADALRKFVRDLDASQLRKPEDVLDALSAVKILDPACGSGAFLLGMLHELVSLRYALFTAKRVDDKTVYERKKSIIEENLYGVDIDPFAVQMAQFRLWLSLAVDFNHNLIDEIPALPNLDFKIRTGDSLVAEYEGVSFHYNPNSWTQRGKKERIDSMIQKVAQLKHNYFAASTQKEKESLRNDINKTLLELVKNELDQEIKNISIQETLIGETKKERATREAKEARLNTLRAALAKLNNQTDLPENFPLLWQIDFADVIKHGGFDVVIGNPPYIRQETLGNAYKAQLKSAYPNVFTGTADLLVNFFELAHQLLRPQGTLSFITSNKWLRAGYGEKLRDFLKTHSAIRTMIDFGDLPVFKQAIAYPMILVAEKAAPKPDQTLRALDVKSLIVEPSGESLFHVLETLAETVERDAHRQPQAALDVNAWRIESQATSGLMQKLKQNSTPLGEFVQGKFYRGITTGFNEAFVIDAETRARLIREDKKSAEIIKPFLRGRDIKRYEIHNPNLYLIFARRGIDIKKYPAIEQHLLQFKTQLEKKAGGNKWYELQASPADTDRFEQPKIIYPEIALNPTFAFDTKSCYSNDTTYVIPNGSFFLLGFLNSKIVGFFYQKISSSIRGDYLRWKNQYVSQIPIPRASALEEKAIAGLVERILSAKARGEDTTALEREIDERVYRLYGLTAAEIAVVETTP